MGLLHSKTLDSSLEDTLEYTEPPMTPAAKRLLDLELDPRSPSTEILRTPIEVKATPRAIFDPRSPSAGIDRTPIFGKPLTPGPEASPLAAGLVETHPPTEDEPAASLPDLDPIPSLPNLDLDNGLEVMNRTVSEPDLSTEDQAELLINRAAPEQQSFKESTPKKKTHRSNSFVPIPVLHIAYTEPQLQVKVKDETPRSPLKVKDTPRSPLTIRTNVDVNSPRAIVQRKQVTKLGITKGSKQGMGSPRKFSPRSPSQYQPIKMTDIENKENF